MTQAHGRGLTDRGYLEGALDSLVEFYLTELLRW